MNCRTRVYPRVTIQRETAVDLELMANTLEKLVPLGLKVKTDEVRARLGLEKPGEDDEVLEPREQVGEIPRVEITDDEPAREALARARLKKNAYSLVGRAAQTLSGATGPMVDAWARRLLGIAVEAGSLEDLRDRLDRVDARDLDAGDFTNLLARALTVAHLGGRDDVDPERVAAAEDAGGAVLGFDRQIDHFRRKLNLSTRAWTDIWQSQHDKAFVVAGAAGAELVGDLRRAVDAAIADGETLASFAKRFDEIVERHGWSYKGGRDWRARVIYETNLRTSYAAGRYDQMKEIAELRPYWRYRHSHLSREPRPHHLRWDKLILRHDDPWWETHYPPNDWGCNCYVEALDELDMRELAAERGGKTGPDEAPPIRAREVTVGAQGPSPRTVQAPEGIGPGWAHAPGRSVAQRRHQAAFRDGLEETFSVDSWRNVLNQAAAVRSRAPELTLPELVAVNFWTGNGSDWLLPHVREMVPPGRGRGVMPDDVRTAFALTLRDALAKLPARRPGALYRSIQHHPRLDEFRPGATVTSNDFWATSYDESEARKFGGIAGVHFTIAAPGLGRDIALLSRNPREQEVLIDYGLRYRVVRRDERTLRDGRTSYEIELHAVQ